MSSTPIKLALLWHQHQPYYRAGNRFLLPWAWLHATKDYLEMAQHLERHPKMHATINLVPSLVKQIDEYLTADATDPVVELMTKPAGELTDDDKAFMLQNFFRANAKTMIASSVRYRELFENIYKTSDVGSPPSSFILHPSSFSQQDFRDLAVHYSLAWTGEIARKEEPFASLIVKDRDYTEEDKRALHQAQIRNVRNIIPLHQTLAKRGQIEVTTTPFYHPILPLLIDNGSALEAMPSVQLPHHPFAAPDEAQRQIRLAREFCKTRLDLEPKGMWPSEGSVSADTLTLIRKNDFEWTATDEGVLANSIGATPFKVGNVAIDPKHAKYFPWRANTPEGPLTVFFRDHRISDDIGFVYQSWSAKEAAEHFSGNIAAIRSELARDYGDEILKDACVSVILDGENCWEYYPDNGFAFLDTLYSMLAEHELIAPVTFTEAIESSNAKRLPTLPRIVAGSWINANFRIWIGHPEDNAAWDAVAAAKETLDRMRQRAVTLHSSAKKQTVKQIELAHEELMIAEGSDWCWWYGDDHYNEQKSIFDELFRMHLRAMYVKLDLTVPENLMRPISFTGNEALSDTGSNLKYGAMHRVAD